MKKRVFILFLGVILSFGITAGIITSGFATKYMMTNMIKLLHQKKIDKITFPKEGSTCRWTSSRHPDPNWRFEYDFGEEEFLIITFEAFDNLEPDSDVCRLFDIIQRNGKSAADGRFYKMMLHFYMYDKNDIMIVSHDKIVYAYNELSNHCKMISLPLRMDKDSGWSDILNQYDIGKIRIIYGSKSFNFKLDDNSSPYSTIEQIKQLSFWVKCPENQLNDIGKKYDVWK